MKKTGTDCIQNGLIQSCSVFCFLLKGALVDKTDECNQKATPLLTITSPLQLQPALGIAPLSQGIVLSSDVMDT